MERYTRFYWGSWVTYSLLLALHMGQSSGESVVSLVALGKEALVGRGGREGRMSRNGQGRAWFLENKSALRHLAGAKTVLERGAMLGWGLRGEKVLAKMGLAQPTG